MVLCFVNDQLILLLLVWCVDAGEETKLGH